MAGWKHSDTSIGVMRNGWDQPCSTAARADKQLVLFVPPSSLTVGPARRGHPRDITRDRRQLKLNAVYGLRLVRTAEKWGQQLSISTTPNTVNTLICSSRLHHIVFLTASFPTTTVRKTPAAHSRDARLRQLRPARHDESGGTHSNPTAHCLCSLLMSPKVEQTRMARHALSALDKGCLVGRPESSPCEFRSFYFLQSAWSEPPAWQCKNGSLQHARLR
jgi:hypothetical protein